MDLILFELGDQNLVTGGGSLIDFGAGEGNWNPASVNPGNLGIIPGQCVELVSVNQGIKQQLTTDVSTGSRTSGRPVISQFTCVKYVDITSPKLYECCLRARLLDTPGGPCRIHILRNSGDRLNLIMQFELTNVLIGEIDIQTHPNDMPTEKFTLSFTEISWIHCHQGPSLSNAGYSAAGWSVARNRPITPGQYTLVK